MKQIKVVAAIIHDDEGRIFATQRGYGDYKAAGKRGQSAAGHCVADEKGTSLAGALSRDDGLRVYPQESL